MKRTYIALFIGWMGLVQFAFVSGQTSEAPQARQSADGKKDANAERIDFSRARQLLRKQKSGEKLTPSEEAYLDKAKEIRRKGTADSKETASTGRDKIGLKPLTEMTAEDRYKGEEGGLYGQGRNTPPEEHRQAAMAQAKRIEPLDKPGKPSGEGRIVLVSISMSNATQEFSTFKRIADSDPAKSNRLTIVDCAQGGQAMAEWVNPEGGPWQVAARRLDEASVTPEQVQVAWIKLANKNPMGELDSHGKKLQRDTLSVVQNAKAKFPNLRIAYLGSRIYGGYTNRQLNPEPYAYESAFPARWLIRDQIRGDAALNYDETRGPAKAPLLLWGPYFWADGVTPRKSDMLVWLRSDLSGDGVHPSTTGREKVARMLLEFFRTDETAKPWFVKH
jgi:hypothetical protein